jgi:hypothetical protein
MHSLPRFEDRDYISNRPRPNGAGFYRKPYQPGSIVKNDIEYVLFLRKGGE